jgi:hypothetical protein
MDHMFDDMKDEIDLYEKEPEKWLRIWRNRYDPMVYQYLTYTYGKQLDTFWKSYIVPKKSEKAFVIVERRCHANLWFILRNIAYYGRGWSIYLFCSRQNEAYCRSVIAENAENVNLIVEFENYADGEKGLREYNELLKQRAFWEKVDADIICTIEMDCYLRKKIPDDILEYDYVGTPWGWSLETPGGSGLTIRKKSAMLHCCDKGNKACPMQDHFAAEAMFQLEYECMPSRPEGVKIFVESYYTEDPVGFHQWWTFFFNRFLHGQDSSIVKNYLTLTQYETDNGEINKE